MCIHVYTQRVSVCCVYTRVHTKRQKSNSQEVYVCVGVFGARVSFVCLKTYIFEHKKAGDWFAASVCVCGVCGCVCRSLLCV